MNGALNVDITGSSTSAQSVAATRSNVGAIAGNNGRANRVISGGANSNGAALATKKSQRREARFRENYDRISAALIAKDSKANRNPTRVLPDFPGFDILSKSEVKKDTKDVAKLSRHQVTQEKIASHASELVDGDGPQSVIDSGELFNVVRSMKPPCEIESTLMQKKRRFEHWSAEAVDRARQYRRIDRNINNDTISHIDHDIEYWLSNVLRSRESYHAFDDKTHGWQESINTARQLFLNATRQCHDLNIKLLIDSQQLYSLCEQECALTNRKRRNLCMRDIVEEIQERRFHIEEQLLSEFEDICTEFDFNGKNVVSTCAIIYDAEQCYIPEPRDYYSERQARDVLMPTSVNDQKDVIEAFTSNKTDYISSAAADALSMPIFDFDHPYEIFDGVQEENMSVLNESLEANLDAKNDIDQRGRSVDESKETIFDDEIMIENETSSRCSVDNGEISKRISSHQNEMQGVAQLCGIVSEIEDALVRCDSRVSDGSFLFFENFSSQIIERSGLKKLPTCHQQLSANTIDGIFEGLRESTVTLTTRSRRKQVNNSQVDFSEADNVITRVDIRSRYPRGVALLLSPLSQYEDRVLGTLLKNSRYLQYGGEDGPYYKYNTTCLPPWIGTAEDEIMERCRIQSTVATANEHLKQMLHRSRELHKLAVEGEMSLQRNDAMLAQIMMEDRMERQRISQDISRYGCNFSASTEHVGIRTKLADGLSKVADATNEHFIVKESDGHVTNGKDNIHSGAASIQRRARK